LICCCIKPMLSSPTERGKAPLTAWIHLKSLFSVLARKQCFLSVRDSRVSAW
jgi:hypothetical protein